MGNVHVDRLKLRLTAPETLRSTSAGLKSQVANSFLPAALQVMERRLSAIYGSEAIVRIHRLRIRCVCRPADLSGGRIAETLGQDLAAQIQEQIRREKGGGLSPAPGASVQVFRGPAHQQAVALVAAANRRAGPDGRKEEFGRLWAAVKNANPRRLAGLLALCREMTGLTAVLSRLDKAQVLALETVIAELADRQVLAVVAAASASATAVPDPTEFENRQPDNRPGILSEDRALGASLSDPETRSDQVHEGDDYGVDEAGVDEPGAAVSRNDSAAGRTATTAEDASVERSPDRPAAGDPSPRVALPEIAPHRTGRDTTTDRASPPDDDAPATERAADNDLASVHQSDICGLIYLVNIALRLELPQRLWQVGADEAAVICAILGRIAGGFEDPATRILSPHFPDPPPHSPPLAGWAVTELVEGVLAEAARLSEDRAPERLRQRITDLQIYFSPDQAFDLVAWGAAVMLAVYEATLDVRLETGRCVEYFLAPGQLAVTADAIAVVQSVEAVDVDIRRAGLDRDPGWLPWLEKRLSFVFSDPEDGPV